MSLLIHKNIRSPQSANKHTICPPYTSPIKCFHDKPLKYPAAAKLRTIHGIPQVPSTFSVCINMFDC